MNIIIIKVEPYGHLTRILFRLQSMFWKIKVNHRICSMYFIVKLVEWFCMLVFCSFDQFVFGLRVDKLSYSLFLKMNVVLLHVICITVNHCYGLRGTWLQTCLALLYLYIYPSSKIYYFYL